jgi:hypothetical protein
MLRDAIAIGPVLAGRQARLVGSLQHDIVTGHTTSAAQTLRQLTPTYDELADALG